MKFPKNPKKGQTKTIKMKGRSVTFKSTGKKGFGAWKIVPKKLIRVGDTYQGLSITKIQGKNTLVGISGSGKIKKITWKKDQWVGVK